jgi:hypothetical protein
MFPPFIEYGFPYRPYFAYRLRRVISPIAALKGHPLPMLGEGTGDGVKAPSPQNWERGLGVRVLEGVKSRNPVAAGHRVS